MKVLLCNRPVVSELQGGDSYKIDLYREAIREQGWTDGYTWQVNGMDLESWDIFHIFHLGHDFVYKFYLEAKRLGKKIILSPIFFPAHSLHHDYMREVVNGSDMILHLSDGEKAWVGSILEESEVEAFEAKSRIVPNGIAECFTEEGQVLRHPNAPNEDYVLCVGRLDVRKNQVKLAQACKKLDIPLLLIGVPDDRLTVETVQGIANSWDGLFWLPPAPREELATAYRGCKVLACPSLDEIWPNVVAEAGMCGSNLLISDRVQSFHDVPGIEVCGTDIDSIGEAVKRAYEKPKVSSADFFKEFTWESALDKLVEAYNEV